MKTSHISAEQMANRVSEFDKLVPLSIQKDSNIPIEGRDVVYARQLLSVIGLDPKDGNTPINAGAPIIGAGGITMTIAKCPPGQRPDLHNHVSTFETFTVLEGTFDVTWNDNGENSQTLEKFDTISVPPGVCRAFKNSGNSDGLLQVIISGGVHDMNDIAFTPAAAQKINSVEADLVHKFEEVGFKFNAGVF